MLQIEINEETVRAMLQDSINKRVEELASAQYFMTMKQLEEYTQMSRPTLMKCFIENNLKYYRVGDQYRFKRDEVDKFLDELTGEMDITNNNFLTFKKKRGEK